MNARNGKIARLPRSLRDLLNDRLDRSEQSPSLLAWLNALPEVQEVLREDFDGVPISKQNLSEWRQGGFQEWLGRRDLREDAGDFRSLSADMQDETSRPELVDDVCVVLAARIGSLITNWNGEVDEKFEMKSRVFNRLGRTVVEVQRGMHRAAREQLEVERITEEKEKAVKEERQEELVGRWFDAVKEPVMAKFFGGGTVGQKIAEYIMAVRRGNLEADLDILPDDRCGDGRPFKKPVKPIKRVKPVKPTRKQKPSPRSRKKKTRKAHKPLVKRKIDDAEEAESIAAESGPVKPGKTSLAQADLDAGSDEQLKNPPASPEARMPDAEFSLVNSGPQN